MFKTQPFVACSPKKRDNKKWFHVLIIPNVIWHYYTTQQFQIRCNIIVHYVLPHHWMINMYIPTFVISLRQSTYWLGKSAERLGLWERTPKCLVIKCLKQGNEKTRTRTPSYDTSGIREAPTAKLAWPHEATHRNLCHRAPATWPVFD